MYNHLLTCYKNLTLCLYMFPEEERRPIVELMALIKEELQSSMAERE